MARISSVAWLILALRFLDFDEEPFELGGVGIGINDGWRQQIRRGMRVLSFYKQFAPTRTGFDWLSRDAAEVDKYVADPLCGFDVTTSLWVDVLDALGTNADPARQA